MLCTLLEAVPLLVSVSPAGPAPAPDLASCITCAFVDSPKAPGYPDPMSLTQLCTTYSALPPADRTISLTCLATFGSRVCRGHQFGNADCW
jgi:hypothetical protein